MIKLKKRVQKVKEKLPYYAVYTIPLGFVSLFAMTYVMGGELIDAINNNKYSLTRIIIAALLSLCMPAFFFYWSIYSYSIKLSNDKIIKVFHPYNKTQEITLDDIEEWFEGSYLTGRGGEIKSIIITLKDKVKPISITEGTINNFHEIRTFLENKIPNKERGK